MKFDRYVLSETIIDDLTLLCEISHHTLPGLAPNFKLSFKTTFKTFCWKQIS